MIRYTLVCAAEHGFESWFPSSDSYDAQVARGLVTCPVCGTDRVGKGMMAPSVARTDRGPRGPAPEAAETPPTPSPAAMPSSHIPSDMPRLVPTEPEQRLRALMQAIRTHVTTTADDVGTAFPEEARRMHYGEAETRAIYGEASRDEARALLDEGIAIAPLPPAADDRH